MLSTLTFVPASFYRQIATHQLSDKACSQFCVELFNVTLQPVQLYLEPQEQVAQLFRRIQRAVKGKRLWDNSLSFCDLDASRFTVLMYHGKGLGLAAPVAEDLDRTSESRGGLDA